MPSTQSMLQDIIRRRRGEFVLDRSVQLGLLRDNLAQENPDQSIFFLSGPAGSGKTALARAMCQLALGENACIAWADEMQPTPLRVMLRWARHLMRAGAQLPAFFEGYQRYLQLVHHIQSDPFWFAGMTKVVNQFTDYVPYLSPGNRASVEHVLIDLIGGQIKSHLRFLHRRLDDAGDQGLLRDPTTPLTQMLISDLNALSEERSVLLALDSFEPVPGRFDAWLEDLIGPHSSLSRRTRFVIAGRDIPSSRDWDARRHLIQYITLEPLSDESIAALCQRYGISDPQKWEYVASISGRLPGPAAMLASSSTGGALDPQASGLVEAAVAWIDSPELQQLVLGAAVPRSWDRPLLEQLLGEDAASSTSVNWLLSRPYVQSTRDQWSVIPSAREAILADLSTRQGERLNEIHQRILTYHTGTLEHLAGSGKGRWRDSAYLLHRAEQTYHQLCLDIESGDAAGDLIEVLLFHLSHAVRWIDIWHTAGTDCLSDTLLEWAQLAEACLARLDEAGWAALAPLYQRVQALPDISPRVQALIAFGEAIAGNCSPSDLEPIADRLARHLPDEPGVFHLIALVQFEGGDVAGARRSCLRMLSTDPSYAPAHMLLGDILMRDCQPDAAAQEYETVVEQRSDYYASEPAMFRLADAQVQMNQPEEALVNYRRAFLHESPDWQQAIAYLERGGAQHRLGRLEEASGDYVNALGMAGGKADWDFCIHVSQTSARRCRGKYQQALGDAEKAFNWLLERSDQAALTPGRSGLAAAHNNRGNLRLIMGEPEGAVWDYEQAIRRERDSAIFYCNRGVAYLTQHMAPRSEREFDEALRLNPNSGLIYFYRGLARARQDRFTEARDDFKRAAQLEPNEPLYVHNIGLAYYHRRSLRRAIVSFRQTIDLDPHYGFAHYHLGLCQADLKEYEAAIAAFDRAIALFVEDADCPPDQPVAAHLDRGAAHFNLGNYESAIHDFERVRVLISRDRIAAAVPTGRTAHRLDRFGFATSPVPQDAIAMERLGEVYSAQGRPAEAVTCFDEALSLAHGDYTEAYAHRGHAYARLRRHRDAINDYLEAIKRSPTSSTLHIAIGNQYVALSQLENALHAYDRAIQLVPTDGEAYLQMGHVSLSLGYMNRAIDSYRMAELFGQQNLDMYLGRAEALRSRGLHRQALADYDRALRLDATTPKAHWGRARVLWRTGKIRPAVEDTFTALGFLIRKGLRSLTHA